MRGKKRAYMVCHRTPLFYIPQNIGSFWVTQTLVCFTSLIMMFLNWTFGQSVNQCQPSRRWLCCWPASKLLETAATISFRAFSKEAAVPIIKAGVSCPSYWCCLLHLGFIPLVEMDSVCCSEVCFLVLQTSCTPARLAMIFFDLVQGPAIRNVHKAPKPTTSRLNVFVGFNSQVPKWSKL